MLRSLAVEAPGRTRVITSQFVVLVGAAFAVFASFGLVIVAFPLYARDVRRDDFRAWRSMHLVGRNAC